MVVVAVVVSIFGRLLVVDFVVVVGFVVDVVVEVTVVVE